MSIDEEVIKAIEEAVAENDQPQSVSKRILKWLEQRTDHEMSREDELRQLDLIMKVINLG